MHQNIKLVSIIAIAFIISFSILLITLNDIEPQLVSLDFQKQFYFQHLDPESKNIFLIGSSESHRLNATYIENYISNHTDNYNVFNLALHSDSPQRRIASLDYIISSEPYMVVYGTGFRDYRVSPIIDNTDTLPENYLPSPPSFFSSISEINDLIPYDFTKIQSPKLHVLRFIRDSLELRTPEVTVDMLKTNTPFMKYDSSWYSVQTDKELEAFYQEPHRQWPGLKVSNSDKAIYSLNQIISKLKENSIHVILISNPSPKQELQYIGNDDIEIFQKTFENIANEHSIPLYFLHDKYSDLPIYNEGNHVTLNKTGLIYSKGVAEIILQELGS